MNELIVPSLSVEIHGTAKSNMNELKEFITTTLSQVKVEPKTEDDLDECNWAIKACSTLEADLTVRKSDLLSQDSEIGRLLLDMTTISDMLKKTRLEVTHGVTEFKSKSKSSIRDAYYLEFRTFALGFRNNIVHRYIDMTTEYPDYTKTGAGSRGMSKFKEALSEASRKHKYYFEQLINDYEAKLVWFESVVESEFRSAFPDVPELIKKPISDFKLNIETRLSDISGGLKKDKLASVKIPASPPARIDVIDRYLATKNYNSEASVKVKRLLVDFVKFQTSCD